MHVERGGAAGKKEPATGAEAYAFAALYVCRHAGKAAFSALFFVL